MTDLKDKNIIVTGASGGIGNSIIEKLNQSRANILASGTRIEKLDEIKEKYAEGNVTKGFVKNLTDYGAFIDLGCLLYTSPSPRDY